MEARKRRNLTWAFVLCGTLLVVATLRADESVTRADRYVFSPEQSTIVQTGGFAGVHWTYSIEGQFCLIVDPNAGSARFEQVDANAVDATEPARTLEPNAVFNLTALAGTVANDAVEFTGRTADGSTVGLTLTFADDTVRLTGETTPPPNSADFFVFSIDAIAARKYGGGTGDPNTPYQIATAEQMNTIGTCPEDWDKHFQLTADIDLAPFDGKEGRPAFNIIAPDLDAEEWDFQGIPFGGVFDGDDHTIAHFSWSGSDTDYVGLFGCLWGSNAEIRHLKLVDPNVHVSSGSFIGTLVGSVAQGSVRNCFVEGGSLFGSSYVGGLAGEIRYDSEVAACRTAVKVTGGSNVGGLVGKNRHAATIYCHTDSDVSGGWHVGGLVGDNCGSVEHSDATGDVDGDHYVGGLVGFNWAEYVGRIRSTGQTTLHGGTISDGHATGRVSGDEGVGGLVGRMWEGSATRSYATSSVNGNYRVGGLIGLNGGEVTSCYSASDVTGDDCAGGLVGENWDNIRNCYASGTVVGTKRIGGLVGYNAGSIRNGYAIGVVCGELQTGGLVGEGWSFYLGVISAYWDIETSGQATSTQGIGKTTAQMQMAETYAGWGGCGDEGIWTLDEGSDYPRLSWEQRPGEPLGPVSLSDHLAGAGTVDDPYLIYTAEELNAVGVFPCEWGRHFRLMADIDLSTGAADGFNMIGDYGTPFAGVFDGNGYMISHFSYYTLSRGGIGLFSWVEDPNALITGVGMVDPNVDGGTGWCVGSLVGWLRAGTVSHCYVRGGHILGGSDVGGLVGRNESTIRECNAAVDVTGADSVGGIAGRNTGSMTECRSTCNITAEDHAGVLVGCNGVERTETGDEEKGDIANCSANGVAVGGACVGGLAGFSIGTIANCYAQGAATGNARVGGLVGYRQKGTITNCYSTTAILGESNAGGLVGFNTGGIIGALASFWDIETSGQKTSPIGTGSTTAQMQTAATYLDAGWDFVGETANGTEDLWWIDEGRDYPRLWWERADEASL